jgi:uncharacterized membrane protein YhaH (DUF805 family)
MSSNGPSNTLKMWIIAGGTVIVLAIVLVLLQAIVDGNIRYDRSDMALRCVHQDQCERPGNAKLLAEFQNTLSNLAYLLFGVCVLVRAGRDGAPARGRPGLLTFGGSLCFLAVCSGWYHASLNFAGTHAGSVLRAHLDQDQKFVCREMPDPTDLPQLLDIVGVYAALIALFLYGVESAFRKELKDADSTRAKIALAGFSIVLPLAAATIFGFIAGDTAVGGKAAGLLLVLMLALLCALTGVRSFVSDATRERPWLMWLLWSLTLIALATVSYIIKPRLHWDSTAVFAVMMGFLVAVLGVN